MQQRGVDVLVSGLVLGLLADWLFYDLEPGVNLPLWLLAVLGTAIWILHRAGRARPLTLAFLGIALLFTAFTAWRVSPMLRFGNILAVGAALITAVAAQHGALRHAGVRQYTQATVQALIAGITGPVVRATTADWSGMQPSGVRRHGPAIAGGLLLAVPVVLIFGSLLTAADPLLEAFVANVFLWDLSRIPGHVALVGVTGWGAIGLVHGLLSSAPEPNAHGSSDRATIGLTPLAIPLGMLTALLAAFVGVQFRYLSGFDAALEQTGLTYAEFARRGFFELLAVSGLMIPLLLLAQGALDRSAPSAVRGFRALVSVLVGLAVLVMLSALARMRLYIDAYGLTEDRLHATAVMLWVGLTLGWLLATEIVARDRFVTGAVMSGFAVLAALTFANPQAMIVRTNVDRAARGAELDVEYLNQLSTDAVPALRARWAELNAPARALVCEGLLRGIATTVDWREWTWSNWRATHALAVDRDHPLCPRGEITSSLSP